MANTSQNPLVDVAALKYFYQGLQKVMVLTPPETVPVASAENKGTTYFIDVAGTYGGQACKRGDHLVSNGSAWVVIPAGTEQINYTADDNVGVSVDNTNHKISNTGVRDVSEPTSEDNAPDGTIKINKNGTESFVAVKGLKNGAFAETTSTADDIVDNGTKIPNASAVYNYVINQIAGVSSSMEFKGAVSSAGDLPTPAKTGSDKNIGWTYKVSGAFTYDSIDCKVGDMLISDGEVYHYIPSANEDNIIEAVKVNGTALTVNATDKSVDISVPSVDTSMPETPSDSNVPSTSLVATQLSTKADSDHTHDEYANQNAFSKFKVSGQSDIEAGSSTSTIELIPGSNVTITTDAEAGTITVSASDNAYTEGAGININDNVIKNTGVISVGSSATDSTAANGTIKVNTNGNVTYVPVKGLAAAAYKDVDTTVTAESENLVTSGAVASAIGTVNEKLDKKITTPDAGQVGQVLKVKTVDESGKPTSWEYGSGGVSAVVAGDVGYTNTTSGLAATTVQGAIDELKNSVSEGKSSLASTLTEQGVTTAEDATFETIATNIQTVATNQYTAGNVAGVAATKVGTAVSPNVLVNTTFTNSESVGIAGTMPNNGSVAESIAYGESYTIPEGYHDGTGTVANAITAGSVSIEDVSGDATSVSLSGSELTVSMTVAPTVSEGYVTTGTAGSVTITGTVPTQAKEVTPTAENQTVNPDEGKLLSSVTVAATPTQVKEATPSMQVQSITPDDGLFLSSVVVNSMPRGGFNNTPTSGVDYADSTADATIIPADGALYINAGYVPNTKITLGHMIPDDIEYDNAGVNEIRAGYEAYSPSGSKLIGTLADVTPKFTGGTPSLVETSNEVATNMATSESGDYYIDATAKAKASRTAVTYDGVATGYIDVASGTTAAESVTSAEDSILASRVYILTATVPNPSIKVDNDGVITASSEYAAGYTPGGSASNTKALSTVAETTYNVSNSDQVIAAGVYVTGAQTVKAVTTSNIDAANIKKGVVVKVGDADNAGRIKDVTGTLDFIDNVETVPEEKSSSIIYDSTTGAYYIWKD